jgi:hypothetical protein
MQQVEESDLRKIEAEEEVEISFPKDFEVSIFFFCFLASFATLSLGVCQAPRSRYLFLGGEH